MEACAIIKRQLEQQDLDADSRIPLLNEIEIGKHEDYIVAKKKWWALKRDFLQNQSALNVNLVGDYSTKKLPAQTSFETPYSPPWAASKKELKAKCEQLWQDIESWSQERGHDPRDAWDYVMLGGVALREMGPWALLKSSVVFTEAQMGRSYPEVSGSQSIRWWWMEWVGVEMWG